MKAGKSRSRLGSDARDVVDQGHDIVTIGTIVDPGYPERIGGADARDERSQNECQDNREKGGDRSPIGAGPPGWQHLLLRTRT